MVSGLSHIQVARIWQGGPLFADVIDILRACGDVAGRDWVFSIGEGFGFPGAPNYLTDPIPALENISFGLYNDGGSLAVARGWHLVSGVDLLHRAAETSQITVGTVMRLRQGRPPLGPPQLIEPWCEEPRIQHPDADLEIRRDYESDWFVVVYEGDPIVRLRQLARWSVLARDRRSEIE